MQKDAPTQASIEAEINPFPGCREYLGTITTSAGKQHKVYMPIVIDYADLDMAKHASMYRLAASSIGLSYLTFQIWALPDAMLVMDKLSHAIDTLTPTRKK